MLATRRPVTSVRVCQRVGQTLVGFLRGERFNVYAHPERVDLTR